MDSLTVRALIAALCGGFSLAGFGVSISVMNAKDRDTFAYLFWNALFTVPLAFFLLGRPQELWSVTPSRLPELIWWIVGGGVASIVGSLCTQKAMKCGNNNLVWAIQQASMLLPFGIGILFFEQRCGFFQISGAILIVVGLFLPVWEKREGDGIKQNCGFLVFAFGSFVLMGCSEAMQNLPSYWRDWHDVGELRSALAYAGGALGSSMAALLLRKRLLPLKLIWKPALGMAFWNLSTVYLMFKSLDWCAEARIGAVGYPVLIGSSIVFFSLYSVLIMKEKTSCAGWFGLSSILSGIAIIAL